MWGGATVFLFRPSLHDQARIRLWLPQIHTTVTPKLAKGVMESATKKTSDLRCMHYCRFQREAMSKFIEVGLGREGARNAPGDSGGLALVMGGGEYISTCSGPISRHAPAYVTTTCLAIFIQMLTNPPVHQRPWHCRDSCAKCG